MPSATSKGVTKDRHGRHSKKCKAYRELHLRERHKLYKLLRHVVKYPTDVVGANALELLSKQFIKPLENGKGLKFLHMDY